MDVTRSNFEQLFPEIKEVINKATFITLDGEFTGLNATSEITPYDTLPEFYRKTRIGSKDFLLVQLGVCMFRYESATKTYKYTCYNFYAFPRPHSRRANDLSFLCQSSSIDFLASQDFDFNKLFRDGIPYLTKDEERRLHEDLQEKIRSRELLNSTTNNDIIPIPDNDKEFIENTCEKVKSFLESNESELILDQCNSFLRRLLYQELISRFQNKLFIESRTQGNRNIVLVLQKVNSSEDLVLKERQRQERDEAEITESAGLSRVLQYIAHSDKLIVGHNMLLDIMHIVKQFFGKLPDDFYDFKDLVNTIFPRILDTKVLSSRSPFKEKINSNVLGHLLATLSEEPFQLPQTEPDRPEVGYSKTEIKEHEAGYDAYMTGLCLLGLTGHLQSGSNGVWDGNCDILESHMNQIFIMRLQDVPYINLADRDVVPSRDHVFFISFPKNWKNSNITQLFSPYGNIQISWMGETSAYVALYKKENSAKAIHGLADLKSSDFIIMPYKEYQVKMQNHMKSSGQLKLADGALKDQVLNEIRAARKRRFTSEWVFLMIMLSVTTLVFSYFMVPLAQLL